MDDFHYFYVKNKYDDEAKLLLTCIDSLVYEKKTSDLCFHAGKEFCCVREFLKDSKLYDAGKKNQRQKERPDKRDFSSRVYSIIKSSSIRRGSHN